VASLALIDATTYIAGYDFTTDTNKVTLSATADELENTTFGGGGYKSRIGGLRDVTANLEGFWQSATLDAVDPQIFSQLATADQVATWSPTGVAGDPCYMTQLGKFTYEAFGDIGTVTPFSVGMSGTSGQGVVRGQLAKAKGNVSATGQLGSILTLTAPTTTQYVYAAFHVFSAGTTITVAVQSDDAVGFPSATTRGTIGPITTVGGTWLTRVAGPFASESFWRLNVTAVTGTFSVAGAIGIQ
jgi:hypothetical protein